LSWLRNFANSQGRLWRTPQIVPFVPRLPLLHPSWPARRKRSLNSPRRGWSLVRGQEDSATMSSAATCLAIHRREDLPAWEQVVHRRVVLVVGGPQAPVPEALQASREDQLEQPRAAVSHLKAVVTNRLIPSASSLPAAYENKQRRSGCSRSALLYFVPDVRPLKRSACGSPTRGYSLISSRTVMPDGIIGSTCSWYGTWTSRRAGPSASISR